MSDQLQNETTAASDSLANQKRRQIAALLARLDTKAQDDRPVKNERLGIHPGQFVKSKITTTLSGFSRLIQNISSHQEKNTKYSRGSIEVLGILT